MSNKVMCYGKEISGGVDTAKDVVFDNTGTGLAAGNVQDAIEELTKIKIATLSLTATSAGQFLIPFSTYKNIVSADLIYTEGYFKTQTSNNTTDFTIRYKNESGTFISGQHQVRVVYFD